MRVVADTHLHLYACYNPGRAITCLAGNLNELAGRDAARLGFLAERHDCSFFASLVGGEMKTEPSTPQIRSNTGGESLVVEEENGGGLYLFPGRQVVTAERIELLALATSADLPDGMSAVEAIEKTLGEGGVPVLAWAPGKWFFGRGRVVGKLLERFDPAALLIGDSSLRPTIWPEPRLMRRARHLGFRVVAGSDPLPFPGEEVMMGSYATALGGEFDPSRPLASARQLLRGGEDPVPVGRRGGPIQVIRRLRQNAAAAVPTALRISRTRHRLRLWL